MDEHKVDAVSGMAYQLAELIEAVEYVKANSEDVLQETLTRLATDIVQFTRNYPRGMEAGYVLFKWLNHQDKGY